MKTDHLCVDLPGSWLLQVSHYPKWVHGSRFCGSFNGFEVLSPDSAAGFCISQKKAVNQSGSQIISHPVIQKDSTRARLPKESFFMYLNGGQRVSRTVQPVICEFNLMHQMMNGLAFIQHCAVQPTLNWLHSPVHTVRAEAATQGAAGSPPPRNFYSQPFTHTHTLSHQE